jgi:predicted exporter
MMPGARPRALAILLTVLLACGWVMLRTDFVSDLSAFMPRSPTERQRLLLEQFRDGVIARLVMIGIEGSDAAERARLSRELAANLRQDRQLFVGVQNGDEATAQRDRDYFFQNRYLLAPDISPEHFTVEHLHAALLESLDTLSGDAGWLFKSIFPRDPTGETVKILERFEGHSQPRKVEGVWASPDGKRALLVVQTRVAGSDIEAQSRIIVRIRQIFDRIQDRKPDTRLLMSGTGVLSVASRSAIEGEIARLAMASLLLVSCLLLAVYRSPVLFLLGMLPVILGAFVGIASVSLGFGRVHSLTLGFGTTLIGEAVDYSIYLFIQRFGAVSSEGFWRTITLGVLTSIAGYSVLLFSGFSSLAQLGLYSISGLVAAALAARYLLPALIPRATKLRDLRRPGAVLERLFNHAVRLRWAALVIVLASGATIVAHSGRIWNRQLNALNPVAQQDQRTDAELRSGLGVSDMRYVAAFAANDEQSALEEAERAGSVLQDLVDRAVIGGYTSPAFVLPSLAQQHSRQSALPDPATARARLSQALEGLPIRVDRLGGFLSDLQAARTRAALTRSDLDGTSAEMLVDSLLVKRERDFLVLLPVHPTGAGPAADQIDIDQVAAALGRARLTDVKVIDILEETTNLFDSYLREALILVGIGCLVIVGLLLASLRSARRTLRVAAPLACSVACVTATLLLCGIQLTILHLVGLLLVVAIGSNYALFFDIDRGAEDRSQVQVSLVVANLTAVSSFGLLGFSRVPVLSAIGTTVGLGTFLALVFSVMLTRSRPHSDVPGPV